MQFQMRKVAFIRKRRFNLIWAQSFKTNNKWSFPVRSSGEFLKDFDLILKVEEAVEY